jgi:hypothetical protein
MSAQGERAMKFLIGVICLALSLSIAPVRAADALVCQAAPDGSILVAPDPGVQTDSEDLQACSFTATGGYEYTSTVLFAWSISVTRAGRSTVEAGCAPVFPGTCHIPTTGVLDTDAGDRVRITFGSHCLVQSIPHTPQQNGPCWFGSIVLAAQ